MAAIQHGGALDAAMKRYGGVREQWLDLSTGINPNAYPLPSMDADIWQRLPDSDLLENALSAARHYYRVPDGVAVAALPGAQAAIQCFPQIVPDGPVDIVTPCYGEYAHILGTRARPVASVEAAGYAVVCANPNNPDGRFVDGAALMQRLESGAIAIVDEAFCDVAPDASLIAHTQCEGCLVVKSFGKFFGLAGVRLGFVMGDQKLVDVIVKSLGPWAVSGPALALAAHALTNDKWIAESRHSLAQMRGKLEKVLSDHGARPVGATDLFVTVAQDNAAELADRLAQNHILVRAFDYAPTWLRFGLPADAADLERLRAAL